MARKMSPKAVVVSRLADGYRLDVTYEVESEGLGPALAEFTGVAVTFAEDSSVQDSSAQDSSDGAKRTNSGLDSEKTQPTAPAQPIHIEHDSRGRMKLEPFLRALAVGGGMDWTDRGNIAAAAMKLGWQTRGNTPQGTCGKVLNRLIDEEPGVSWIRRRGGQRSRQYQILPLSEAEGRPP